MKEEKKRVQEKKISQEIEPKDKKREKGVIAILQENNRIRPPSSWKREHGGNNT